MDYNNVKDATNLPYTGFEPLVLIVLAAVLIAVGVSVYAMARR